MILSRLQQLFKYNTVCITNDLTKNFFIRMKTHYRNGVLKPMPEKTPFGILRVLCTVFPGLFVGACISKNVANFLEENDLFVPSDDDDDED